MSLKHCAKPLVGKPVEICSFKSPRADNSQDGTTKYNNTVVSNLQLPSLNADDYFLVITSIQGDTGNSGGMANSIGQTLQPSLIINNQNQLTIKNSALRKYYGEDWGNQWYDLRCNGKVYYKG